MANAIVQPSFWSQLPKADREVYKIQWQLLTQAIDEQKDWLAKKAAAPKGSEEFKKASKKASNYSRWIADILQAPPETFAGIDMSRGKVGPDVHDLARRIMKQSTSTGGTMHHITAIMQTVGASKGLGMLGVWERDQRLKELGIALGTQDPNLVEVDSTTSDLHKGMHAQTEAGKTDWANKPWTIKDTKDWKSIEARVKAIQESSNLSRAAQSAVEQTEAAKAYRERLASTISEIYGEDVGKVFMAGQADPSLRDAGINELGIKLNTELNRQGVITPQGELDEKAFSNITTDIRNGSPSTANSKRLLKIVQQGREFLSNPQNLLKAGVGAATLATALKPGRVDAAQALTPEVVDKYHNEGWWSGSKELGINGAKEVANGLPSVLTIGGLTTLAPATTGAVLTAGAPVLGGLAIAGGVQAAGKAYSRHLEHTTGSGLGEHYARYRYQTNPLMNPKADKPRKEKDRPTYQDPGPLQIQQGETNPIKRWWNREVNGRVSSVKENFDPNKGDWGVTELMFGTREPGDQLLMQ